MLRLTGFRSFSEGNSGRFQKGRVKKSFQKGRVKKQSLPENAFAEQFLHFNEELFWTLSLGSPARFNFSEYLIALLKILLKIIKIQDEINVLMKVAIYVFSFWVGVC